jgi:uncharacterized protein YndB with AHSA1/START domain
VSELGRYVEVEGRPAVRFERVYPHPIARVWAAVTEPAELAKWFPSSVELEPTNGGTVKFAGDPYSEGSAGTILAFDPPRHLAFTWGADELHVDLEAVDEASCRLTLTNVLNQRDAAARNASGWTLCLAELSKHVAGEDSKGPHSGDALPFQPLYDAHISAGLPWGAEIPAAALET